MRLSENCFFLGPSEIADGTPDGSSSVPRQWARPKKSTKDNNTKNIYIYMPITSLGGPCLGLNMSRSRGREKTKAEKRKNKKEEKTLKHEKPHLLGGGVSWPFLTKKTGIFLRFLTQTCPPTEVTAIYICIYIFILRNSIPTTKKKKQRKGRPG